MDHSKPNNTDINLIAWIKKKPAQKAGFFFVMVFEIGSGFAWELPEKCSDQTLFQSCWQVPEKGKIAVIARPGKNLD